MKIIIMFNTSILIIVFMTWKLKMWLLNLWKLNVYINVRYEKQTWIQLLTSYNKNIK